MVSLMDFFFYIKFAVLVELCYSLRVKPKITPDLQISLWVSVLSRGPVALKIAMDAEGPPPCKRSRGLPAEHHLHWEREVPAERENSSFPVWQGIWGCFPHPFTSQVEDDDFFGKPLKWRILSQRVNPEGTALHRVPQPVASCHSQGLLRFLWQP